MTRLFCPRCGLSLDGAVAQTCARCGVVFAATDQGVANFDETSGAPRADMPKLRCWHCGEPIGNSTVVCSSCGTDLTRRGSAAVRFEVVPPRSTPVASAHAGESVGDAAAWPAPSVEPSDDPYSGPRRGYFRRHWRGQLPLGVSVWVNVFLLSFGLNLVLILAQRPLVWSDSGLTLLIATLGLWLVRVVVAVWQVVGVWRAAGASIRRRRRQRQTYAWAFIARVWIVLLGAGWTIAFAIVGYVSIREDVLIALGDDPMIPPYTMVVVPGGTAVVITGGIRFGISGDLAEALEANPGIRTVYLASEGGRLAPGGALFKLIRRHGLDTYALGPCYSACTFAFAGGLNRVVGQHGDLGFHAPSFSTAGSPDLEQSLLVDFLQPYREAAFEEWVITRTRNTPPEDMWFPPDATLLDGGVLTEPRDSVARPDEVPVEVYLASLTQTLEPYLPLEIVPGLSIASIEAAGDQLTLVMLVDRTTQIPPGLFGPVSPTICGMAGSSTGATYVFVARYPDGEEIARTEFDSARCEEIQTPR